MDTTIITGNRSFGDGNKMYDTTTVGASIILRVILIVEYICCFYLICRDP